MINRVVCALTVFVLLSIFIPAASAGITLNKGEFVLRAGETGTFCDLYVFATQNGGTYHIETTQEIESLTVAIQPNDFLLDEIDCPGEQEARVACKNELCQSGVIDQCRQICIYFKAPLLFAFDPEPRTYRGGISNTIQIELASISEPVTLFVTVIPIDIKPFIAAGIALVFGIFLLLHFMRKKKSFSYSFTPVQFV